MIHFDGSAITVRIRPSSPACTMAAIASLLSLVCTREVHATPGQVEGVVLLRKDDDHDAAKCAIVDLLAPHARGNEVIAEIRPFDMSNR